MTASSSKPGGIPAVQQVAAILWPSFIMSGMAAIVFFAAFDPVEVLMCNGYPSPSRLGSYTIGFFLFWLLTASSCLLSTFFGRPCPTTKSRTGNQAESSPEDPTEQR